MELKINGTVTINTESGKNQSEDKLSIQTAEQETTIPFDHSKDVLIDNSTTFNELIRILARNPEVAIAGQLEAEEQEQEEREAKLREAFGEDYDLVFEKGEGEVVREAQKPKRRPGAIQLRNGYPRVAMIEMGKNTSLEVFNNGYAIYDNGNRKVVLWVPDCGSATYYFTGLRDNEKEYLNQSSEIGLDVLGDLPWYHALMIAGENRIEYNMDHPKSKGNTSDFDIADMDTKPATHWVGACHFDSPEEAYLKKEAAEEKRKEIRKSLSIKQNEVFWLYYEEEHTVEEIANRLGVSFQAVAERLKSGRKNLKKNKKIFE